jgi:gamma-tubulin complex component 4
MAVEECPNWSADHRSYRDIVRRLRVQQNNLVLNVRSGNYFLTRNASLTQAFIKETYSLIITKLLNSNPKSSSSVIREQDLHLALLRSSVGTPAENDRSLDTIRFKLPSGPLRPLLPSHRRTTTTTTSQDGGVGDLFSSFLLGAPMVMTTKTTWPLDLFITPTTLSAYSEINAYLTALRDTHLRVTSTWTSLSAAQRNRRKWTGNTEGGAAEEARQRRDLGRRAWGVIRIMLFWLDEVIGHFMVDIIDVQHRRLLEQLEGVSPERTTQPHSVPNSLRGSVRPTSPATHLHTSRSQFGDKTATPSQSIYDYNPETATIRSRAPPTPSKHDPQQKRYLDFLTLRSIHTRHLSFLREGLLLADKGMAVLIRDILETCRRFTGIVERWSGDVLPGLLEDDGEGDVGSLLGERSGAVEEIMTVSRV